MYLVDFTSLGQAKNIGWENTKVWKFERMKV